MAGQDAVLNLVDVAKPETGSGEILIQVRAAGVTPSELLWSPTTHTKSGAARIHAIPGHEFSGVIAAIGKDVQGFKNGDEVYGMNDWFAEGATAEFCLALPQNIARKPATLTHEAAASVPIGALSAWQGLLDRAKLQPGERVLVHGGAGAVGLYATQLAHIRGARVAATVSNHDMEFVKQLGAEQAIDYKAERFEEEVQDVDVIFDTVGGDTLGRSWAVLKPSGRLVTIAASNEDPPDQRTKDAFFVVEPNQKQLTEIARQLDAGQLKTFVKAALPLSDAAAAYRGAAGKSAGHGKIVVSMSLRER